MLTFRDRGFLGGRGSLDEKVEAESRRHTRVVETGNRAGGGGRSGA